MLSTGLLLLFLLAGTVVLATVIVAGESTVRAILARRAAAGWGRWPRRQPSEMFGPLMRWPDRYPIEAGDEHSIVGHVEPAAEIKRRQSPAKSPDNRCPACGARPPAGMLRCPRRACREVSQL